MSELRLYCDLLMQQVHTIHESVEQEGDGAEVSHHMPYFFLLDSENFSHFELFKDFNHNTRKIPSTFTGSIVTG